MLRCAADVCNLLSQYASPSQPFAESHTIHCHTHIKSRCFDVCWLVSWKSFSVIIVGNFGWYKLCIMSLYISSNCIAISTIIRKCMLQNKVVELRLQWWQATVCTTLGQTSLAKKAWCLVSGTVKWNAPQPADMIPVGRMIAVIDQRLKRTAKRRYLHVPKFHSLLLINYSDPQSIQWGTYVVFASYLLKGWGTQNIQRLHIKKHSRDDKASLANANYLNLTIILWNQLWSWS